MDLNTLNNEQMMQYTKRLQTTFEQYKAQDKASQGITKVREETSQKTPRARGEAAMPNLKGKVR